MIPNNNIRSVILEIKNDRIKIVKILDILTILDLSFLISNMTRLILLFAIKFPFAFFKIGLWKSSG